NDPALDAINKFMSDEAYRKKALVVNLLSQSKFRQEIYKPSYQNMARAIRQRDRELFCAIDANEFFNTSLDKLNAKKDDAVSNEVRQATKSRMAYADHTADITRQVTIDILGSQSDESADFTPKNTAQMALAIDYWINVAYELVYLSDVPDLNGALAIF